MVTTRRATLDDLDALIHFRMTLFREMGLLDSNTIEKSFHKECKDFFCQFIPNEEFLSWIAEDEDEIIATSG
ncbi:MAG: hypothetical protein JSV04_03390, partial [Candidatus Heimdallarchaeota archaeon]